MKDLGSIKGAGLPQAAEARLEQWRLRIRELHGSVEATEARLRAVAQRAEVPGVVNEPDLTPPPTPGDVMATAGLSFVFIETDEPQFEQGHGYLRTLVYGAKFVNGALPTFANAVKVHEFVGKVGSFPSEPKTQWHIWVKWLSADGVESAVPAGGTNGFQASTANDVSKLLEAMLGQVTASQLHGTLGSRVDLIDGPAGLANSVAARVANEATVRSSADASLQASVNTVQANLVSAQGSLQASIDGANAVRAAGDAVLAARSDVLSAAHAAGALNADPLMSSLAEFWSLGSGTAPARVVGSSTNWFAFRSSAEAWYHEKRRIPFDRSKTYRVSARARRSGGDDGSFYLVIQAWDASGAQVPSWGFGATWSFYAVSGTSPGTAWTDYSVPFSASTHGFPANVTAISVGVIQSYNASNGGWMEVEQVRMVDDTGAKAAADLSAVIQAEQTARVNGDSANAASINTVSARLNSGGDVAQSIVTAQTAASAAQASANSAQGAANTVASSVTTLQSRINRVMNYRIVARGAGDTTGGVPGMFAEDGTQLHGVARSHTLVVLNGTTGVELSHQTYDVYGNGANTSGRNAATLAADLNALDMNKVVVLYTYDEPSTNSTAGGLPAALKRCGATQTTLDRIKFHGAYLLVGIPGMGEGSGIERYAGDVGSSSQAWVELQLQLVNGRPVGLAGGAAVPQLAAVVQQETSTRASETGYLGAQWTVRMTAGNVAGGFGLSGSSAPGAGGTIDFGVRANRFFVAPPEGVSGVGNIVPFTVQTTPFTNPSTGEVLPAGVYMSAAYIRDLQVALGRFQQAVITSAMIANLDATKITTGFLDTNRLAANSLDSTKINTNGLTIRDAGGNVIFGSGAGQPNLSNAGAVALVASANMRMAGGTAEKVSGGSSWDGGVRSVDGYVGGAFASATVGRNDCFVMFGLNTDPAADNSYGSIDFAWYAVGDGSCQIYENGAHMGSFGTYAPGDVFTVAYDGSVVRYLRNGAVMRSVVAGIAAPLYFDTAFYNEGGRLHNVRFGPYGNPSAVQPSNPITAGNVTTYIANAAIQNAQIGDAQITNAKISGDLQSDNFASGSSGWRIRKGDGSAEFAAASIRGKLTTSQLEVGSVTANAVASQGAGGATLANSTAVQVLIAPAANNALLTLALNGGFSRVTAVWNGGVGVAKSSAIAFVTCDCSVEMLDESNNVLLSYTSSQFTPQWARASVPIYPNNDSSLINKGANFSFAIQFMFSGVTGVRKFRFVLWNFQGVTMAGVPAAPGTTGVLTGIGTIIAQEHRV